MKGSKYLFLSLLAVFLLLILPASAEAEEPVGLSVCGVEVTAANQSDILGDGGSISYDSGSKTLTLQGDHQGDQALNKTVEGGSFIHNESVDGLVIAVSGNVDVMFNGECAMQLNRSTTLTGGGSLSLDITGSDGILISPSWEEIERSWDTGESLPAYALTIDGISLTVQGTIYHGIMGNYGSTLAVRGADVDVQTIRSAICDFYGGFSLEDCRLQTPSGGTIICGNVAEMIDGYPDYTAKVTITSENAKGFVTKSFMNENGSSVGWTCDPTKNTFTATWDNPEDYEPLLVASYDENGKFLGITVVEKTGEETSDVLKNGVADVAVFWLGEGSAPQCEEGRFSVAGK